MTQPDISEGWSAGESVTAQKLNRFTKDMFDWLMSHREPQVYTPQLIASSVNPNLGSGGVATGLYWRDPITGWVKGWFYFRFSGTGISAGSGDYRVTLPSPARAFVAGGFIGSSDIYGTWSARDDSAANASPHGLLTRVSSNGGPGGVAVCQFSVLNGTVGLLAANNVFPFDAGDVIHGHFHYPEPLT